jgi:dipeptidyl-peptidase-4
MAPYPDAPDDKEECMLPERHAAAHAWLLLLLWTALPGRTGAEAPQLEPQARAHLVHIIETRGFTRGLPRKPVPSPDGRRVYFLRSGPTDRMQQLYEFDVESGRTRVLVTPGQLAEVGTVSPREQARRERQRETEAGITAFQLSRDGARLLVPYAGDLFVVETANNTIRRLTRTDAAEVDAHESPDGKRVAFVRERDLFLMDIDGGEATALTRSSDDAIQFGAAEFVAQEELDRDTGHWWSPDSRHLALTEVDTRPIPPFAVPNLTHPEGAASVGPYPKPGDANARVRLGVVDVASGATRWFDLGEEVEYIARVNWDAQSGALWVQTLPRRQRSLDLHRIDLAAGTVRRVLREEDADWVNLHDNFHPLQSGSRFVWSSERSGKRNLEIASEDGERERILTPSDMNVRKLLHVDEERGLLYFTAWWEDPRELHVYRVSLETGEVERLTQEPGWHEAFFHERGHDVYVESFSDESTPTRFRVRRSSGEELGELPSAAHVPMPQELGPRPEFVELTTPEGVRLDVRLVRPAGTGALPLVVYVYGGPHGQQARRRWGGERERFDAWMAQRGYAMARIDGRGAWGRGHDSERIYSGRMGEHELHDQVAGVRSLLEHVDVIDPNRVGIWGWSYGGYMTLMALMRAPEVFQVGVSVAPVVDWRGYDTGYTERYLGLPIENGPGYEASSVLTYASGLRGHLTLVHGASDDNVHMRESMILVQKLVELGKPFDLMIYPGTHMIQSVEERSHLYELIWRAFAENL